MSEMHKVPIQPSNDVTATALAIAYQLFDDHELNHVALAERPITRATLTAEITRKLMDAVRPPPAQPSIDPAETNR